MKRFALAAVLASAALAVSPQAGLAQDAPDRVSATECCVSLLPPVGARALALGNALVARSVADALAVNPASSAALTRGELRVHTERTDISNTTSMALLFGIGAVGVAGISYRLLDFGEQEVTTGQGDVVGRTRVSDQLLAVSFATRATRRVRAGVQYQLYQWRSDCTGACNPEDAFSATTHLVDVGAQLDAPWLQDLQLGAAVLHAGPKLQVKNADQRDPTPMRIRIGVAYELLQHFRPDSTSRLIASVDLNRGANQDVESGIAAGLELILDQSLFVRAGYATGTGKGTGGSVGVGMLYDRFDIGVAKSFSSSQDGSEPFQVTFAVRF